MYVIESCLKERRKYVLYILIIVLSILIWKQTETNFHVLLVIYENDNDKW